MVDWNGAMAAMDAAVAETFDVDAFRALPRADGIGVNAPRGPDPLRAEFDFMGTLDRGPAVLPVSQRPAGDPGSVRVPVSHEAVVTALAVNWPWVPKRDDHLTIAGERWEIVDLIDDGSARKTFLVNRV